MSISEISNNLHNFLVLKQNVFCCFKTFGKEIMHECENY